MTGRRRLAGLRPHGPFIGLVAVVLLALVGTHASSATTGGVEGSQGTNTALPLTDSAVTIKGSDVLGPDSPFANLTITVNQTRGLSNQAISVTWTGGTPTNSDLNKSGLFNDNYLQIFQCWGPDDGSNPADPGPAPTGCEFGANEVNNPVITLSAALGAPITRRVAVDDTSHYAWTDPGGAGTFIPFDPVDGSAPINITTQASSNPEEPNVWLNPLFDYTTTNEVDYARTYPDGTGQQLFTADTGLEAPGLGCGQSVTQPNGSSVAPACWLVIVPRGSAAYENPPGSGLNTGPNAAVGTSPLSGAAYAHRIAIPLTFNSVAASCPLGATQDRIVGSELAAPAVGSWEPKLCSAANAPPYQFSTIADDQARQEVLAGGTDGPGMAVVTQPIDPSLISPSDPVTYAPMTLSGVVIGFNIDRQLNVDNADDDAEAALIGQNVAHIYLTPRLVAKLLTESYVESFVGLNKFQAPPGYSWLRNNPFGIFDDPDFLQFNPEFKLLDCQNSPDCAGLIVEQPSSDAAYTVWNWILSDPEAKAWLEGAPDPWGMTVNPYYNLSATQNPSQVGFASTGFPESYPKADPYLYQDETQLVNANNQLPRPLGMGDALPYQGGMQAAALATRNANDGAKLTADYGAVSPELAWTSNGPKPVGEAFDMSITDSADAAQYGLQTAALSRAGDDGSDRTFISPDNAGLEAGQQAMVPSATAGVLTADPATTFPGAYPLSMLTYAAVPAPGLSAQLCKDYAAFITYGTTAGQTSGTALGDLPPGYAPLDPELVAEAKTAAATIVAQCGKANTSTSTPTTPLVTSTPSSSSAGSNPAPTATNVASAAMPTSAATSASAPTLGGLQTPSLPTGASGTTEPAARTAAVELSSSRLAIPILIGLGLVAVVAARWTDVLFRRARRR